VEIKHRGDCIDAQSIDVKLLEPVERVCDEEIAHLVAAVVEDISAPIGMLAFVWIEMFVESRAIKAAESPGVLRKVRGNPVHDHADATAMKIVDQETQIVRLAVTSRRRVVRGDLISPRWSIWMLFERQKLDVCKAHLT